MIELLILENMVYDNIERVWCGEDMWSDLEKSVSSNKHPSKIQRKIFNSELPEVFSYKSLPFPTFFFAVFMDWKDYLRSEHLSLI